MRALILALALLTPLTAAPAVVHQEEPGLEITENTWQGALVDWDCKQARVDQVCAVGPNTKRFALSVDGGILLHFDDHGNELALKAVRQTKVGGNVDAVAVGEREGRLLKVEAVRIGTANPS